VVARLFARPAPEDDEQDARPSARRKETAKRRQSNGRGPKRKR
jgi:hypothetical protein